MLTLSSAWIKFSEGGTGRKTFWFKQKSLFSYLYQIIPHLDIFRIVPTCVWRADVHCCSCQNQGTDKQWLNKHSTSNMIVPDKRTIHTHTQYCPYLTIACIKFLCHSTLVGVCAVCHTVLSQVMLTVLCSIVVKAPGPSRVCYRHIIFTCPALSVSTSSSSLTCLFTCSVFLLLGLLHQLTFVVCLCLCCLFVCERTVGFLWLRKVLWWSVLISLQTELHVCVLMV